MAASRRQSHGTGTGRLPSFPNMSTGDLQKVRRKVWSLGVMGVSSKVHVDLVEGEKAYGDHWGRERLAMIQVRSVAQGVLGSGGGLGRPRVALGLQGPSPPKAPHAPLNKLHVHLMATSGRARMWAVMRGYLV